MPERLKLHNKHSLIFYSLTVNHANVFLKKGLFKICPSSEDLI